MLMSAADDLLHACSGGPEASFYAEAAHLRQDNPILHRHCNAKHNIFGVEMTSFFFFSFFFSGFFLLFRR